MGRQSRFLQAQSILHQSNLLISAVGLYPSDICLGTALVQNIVLVTRPKDSFLILPEIDINPVWKSCAKCKNATNASSTGSNRYFIVLSTLYQTAQNNVCRILR